MHILWEELSSTQFLESTVDIFKGYIKCSDDGYKYREYHKAISYLISQIYINIGKERGIFIWDKESI